MKGPGAGGRGRGEVDVSALAFRHPHLKHHSLPYKCTWLCPLTVTWSHGVSSSRSLSLLIWLVFLAKMHIFCLTRCACACGVPTSECVGVACLEMYCNVSRSRSGLTFAVNGEHHCFDPVVATSLLKLAAKHLI